MLDALKFDDIDEKDDEAENTEAYSQRYTGILQYVHALVSADACIRPHTHSHTHTHTQYVRITNNISNHDQ